MALVSAGKISGSLNMKRHAIGPRLKYVLRNVSKGPFNSRSSKSAILITTSGLSRPWAVEKFGRVSDGARIDCSFVVARDGNDDAEPQQLLATAVDVG